MVTPSVAVNAAIFVLWVWSVDTLHSYRMNGYERQNCVTRPAMRVYLVKREARFADDVRRVQDGKSIRLIFVYEIRFTSDDGDCSRNTYKECGRQAH
jgi:hypothetical protein